MFRDPVAATRNLGRVRTIAGTFLRHGLSDLMVRTGIHKTLSRASRVIHKEPAPTPDVTLPQRLCLAFEELGPAFVKLGQLFASRVDFFPPDWIDAFEQLQDRVPAVAFEEIRAQLEADLGAPPHEVFRDLEETPLAAASLAQVYGAKLEDGTPVVLKVRRPGIEKIVEQDLQIIEWMAEIVERESPILRTYRPRKIVSQFTRAMRTELDFLAECHHSEQIGRQFADKPDVIVPRVYWAWSSERLNVQQRIFGIKGHDLEAVDAAGLDRSVLARRGAEALLTMILDEGTFHGDPHAGNLFYLPENRIALVDFGVVGRLSTERRDQLSTLFAALIDRRSGDAVDVLQEWTSDGRRRDDLVTDVEEMVSRYHGLPLERMDTTQLLVDLTAVLRDHRIVLPRELVLLIKSLILVGGLGKRLDPTFDVFTAAAPMIRRSLRARYGPARMARRARAHAMDMMNLLSRFPRDARKILTAASRGELGFKVDMVELDEFGRRMDRALGRLTVGIVLAAIIVGSAIGMRAANQPRLLGLPVLAYIGFLGAAAAGVWLLASFWRARR